VVFLPEASDFIARNSKETVRMARELGPIKQNSFIRGLQDQAKESKVAVTVGVHLPTGSDSHVRLLFCTILLTISAQTLPYGSVPQEKSYMHIKKSIRLMLISLEAQC
jgi:hypothetical protein